MTQREIIDKCPGLLNPSGARGGRLAQARELRWLRENLPADDALLVRAEWRFGPARRGIPWQVFKKTYKANGPPGYAYPGLGVG